MTVVDLELEPQRTQMQKMLPLNMIMLKGNTEEHHAEPTLSMRCYEIVSQSLKFQVYLTLISQYVILIIKGAIASF